jgi:dynactin complex subunit
MCHPSDPSLSHLLGQRVLLRTQYGSIRYVGKLINNPKAGDDIWLGIEWDEDGQKGKHSGMVDGIRYFTCEFHRSSPHHESGETQCCSFIRYGKIQIGGVTLREAVIEKYRPDDLMSETEKEKMKEIEQEDIYVNTDKKGMKKIQVLGQEKSYKWRSDVR